MIKNLKDQLKSQTEELQHLQEKYKIKQVQAKPTPPSSAGPDSSSGAGGAGSVSGVLV